jgi:hypothetical protein
MPAGKAVIGPRRQMSEILQVALITGAGLGIGAAEA